MVDNLFGTDSLSRLNGWRFFWTNSKSHLNGWRSFLNGKLEPFEQHPIPFERLITAYDRLSISKRKTKQYFTVSRKQNFTVSRKQSFTVLRNQSFTMLGKQSFCLTRNRITFVFLFKYAHIRTLDTISVSCHSVLKYRVRVITLEYRISRFFG